MMIVTSLLLSRAWAACVVPTTAAQIDALLDDAEAAYVDLDASRFTAALDRAAIALPCLDASASPALASKYHRVQGIRLFAAGDAEGATAAFSAALAADPTSELSDDLAPPGNALRSAWEAAAPVGLRVPLFSPEASGLRVDGEPATDRPADRPTIVQLLANDGHVLATAWLQPWEPAPYAPTLGTPTSEPAASRPSSPRLGRPLALGAAGAAAASLGAYGAALQQRAAFDAAVAEQADWTELDVHRDAANGLVGTALGLGITAVGLAAASALVVRF